MNENILKALMQLFALLINPDEKNSISEKERSVIESYLNFILNKKLAEEYLSYFDKYFNEFYADLDLSDSKKVKKKTSLKAIKVLKICEQINFELNQVQKFIVLVLLIEYVHSNESANEIELEFIQTVADAFNISEDEFNKCLHLATIKTHTEIRENEFLIISGNDRQKNNNIVVNYLDGDIYIIHLSSCNLYFFKYLGESALYLNNQALKAGKIYLLDFGASIKGQKINNIYYTDIVSHFLNLRNENNINLLARQIEFKFKNSSNGIHNFNFSENSCKLVGIMGGSGVGKSTLLNIFNGNIKPDSGEILINGYDIHKEKDKIRGIIGFVPQDDLLIEELTVFQNLFYSAKLCFDKYDNIKLKEIVEKTLEELELIEIKDLKVGNALNKFISGGQRKRLNIALELIREPSVLFVDEPTSGLSSMDSQMVMDLLKELTLKGKLIIVNIHQPSSDIYKMFDKIIILDKGGYMVYYGNPLDAVVYFKKKSNFINSEESVCEKCGNVNPEQVLEILEAKVVNEYGKLTRIRKVSPKEWNEKFEQENKKETISVVKTTLPESNFETPNFFKQLVIFIKRDLLTKLANRQYLIICLLEAPILAFILGFFTKFISNDKYTLIDNENLPSFLFMSVVVALFLGLSIAAEEIIRDRKIRKREKFLNLNNGSYINAKVIVMFLISSIQTITFVLIGNYILDIKGMTLNYWLVLFTASCFSNMLGLLISSLLNSVVTIYILIPFILVPQILFTGVIVKFDKLHKSIASDEYVSLLGDVMISRWAYEAIAVNQFQNNKYQKPIFNSEKKMSNYSYFFSYLIPEIQVRLTDTYNDFSISNKEIENKKNLSIINTEIEKLRSYDQNTSFNDFYPITIINDSNYKSIYDYLDKMRDYFNRKYNKELQKRDKILSKIDDNYAQIGGIEKIKEEYFNNSLDDLMRNKMEINKIVERNGKLIPLLDPIFREPTSKIGRAHFYSPIKKIGNYSINTYTFNLIVIWLAGILLYFLLLTDVLNFRREQ